MQAHIGLPLGVLSVTWVIGCSVPPAAMPGGGPGAEVPPAPSLAVPDPGSSAPPAARPSVARLLRLDFAQLPLGPLGADAPFVDVDSELQTAGKAPPSWLYRGHWEIADVATPQLTGRVLRQTQVQERPPITLLRFRGSFAGLANGRMPDHYRMEVTQQPVRSPYNLPPTGDQGIQPYYLDANHYVEVVTTPRQLQLWVCHGGVPDAATDWEKLWSEDLATAAGDVRRVGAIVDKRQHRFTLLYNGVERADVTVDLIDPSRESSCTLRAIGNEVNFSDFELERLP